MTTTSIGYGISVETTNITTEQLLDVLTRTGLIPENDVKETHNITEALDQAYPYATQSGINLREEVMDSTHTILFLDNDSYIYDDAQTESFLVHARNNKKNTETLKELSLELTGLSINHHTPSWMFFSHL